MIKRYFLEIAFDGTAYHGWQVQPNADSIQDQINVCLSKLLRTEIFIQGAGRTDAGVHARQTYAHFDFDGNIDADFSNRCNSFLPFDIQIVNCVEVDKDSHCRFDAISRTYEYFISSNKNPFYTNKAFYFYKKLNLELIRQAIPLITECSDFSSFSKSNTQTKTNNCKIYSVSWQEKNDMLVFEIKADRFLRNMVRSIVGTFIELGIEKITLLEFKQIIDSKDRSRAGFSVPACGLYLKNVDYPQNIWIK
jgi:tRNA pseudouridine38-40 synthase